MMNSENILKICMRFKAMLSLFIVATYYFMVSFGIAVMNSLNKEVVVALHRNWNIIDWRSQMAIAIDDYN